MSDVASIHRNFFPTICHDSKQRSSFKTDGSCEIWSLHIFYWIYKEEKGKHFIESSISLKLQNIDKINVVVSIR